MLFKAMGWMKSLPESIDKKEHSTRKGYFVTDAYPEVEYIAIPVSPYPWMVN